MMRIFKRMNELCPGHVHVNGIEHNAWFKVANFSVEALTAQQQIVPLHSYPYWSEAIKHTKPLEQPYIELHFIRCGTASTARWLRLACHKRRA